MKTVIEVSGLSKYYNINHKDRASYSTIKDDVSRLIRSPFSYKEDHSEKFWALKDISFDVKEGQIFGVVGQNGSGKSTLLKILSRVVDPTSGQIAMHGRVSSLLEVGTGFHPELTGRENIFFNGSVLGMSRKEIQRKFNEIVEFSEVEKFIDTPVKFYSSGMYVRLAFSVAAHLDPDILILDEVLAVGDAAFQQKSLKKIQSTMRDGKTVLFVSHSMGSVRQLCTDGIMLEKGKIVASGKIDSIIEAYTNATEKKIALRMSQELQPTWKNPNPKGDDDFIAEEVYVSDEKNNVITEGISNGKNYKLHIKGIIKNHSPLLNIGYTVWDESGQNMLYMTFSTDKAKEDWPKLKKGPVHIVADIPKNLLSAGFYTIKLVSSVYGERWIMDPDSSNVKLSLNVKHADQLSPLWSESRGGLFSPSINWIID